MGCLEEMETAEVEEKVRAELERIMMQGNGGNEVNKCTG